MQMSKKKKRKDTVKMQEEIGKLSVRNNWEDKILLIILWKVFKNITYGCRISRFWRKEL